jgi:hypothetical protein
MNKRVYVFLAALVLVCGTPLAARAAADPPAEPDKTLTDHAKDVGSAVKRGAKAVGAAVKDGAQKVAKAAKHGAEKVKAAVKHDKANMSDESGPPATSEPEN